MDVIAKFLIAGAEKGYLSDTPISQKEREERNAQTYNRQEGRLNESDGYLCDICHNKGQIAKAELSPFPSTEGEAVYNLVFYPCKCMKARNSIKRLKRSGLEPTIKAFTFDKFNAESPWQGQIKKAAMEFAKNQEGWFFIGGQSGCGKTHICTAICRELILAGKDVLYMRWRDEAVRLKGYVTEPDVYSSLIEPYKQAEVLYIDDLFKTGKVKGMRQMPTEADVNLAFEIINYRYMNPELITIISSECGIDELETIDEAIAGRIFERSVSFSVKRDREKNYRMRNVKSI